MEVKVEVKVAHVGPKGQKVNSPPFNPGWYRKSKKLKMKNCKNAKALTSRRWAWASGPDGPLERVCAPWTRRPA